MIGLTNLYTFPYRVYNQKWFEGLNTNYSKIVEFFRIFMQKHVK